MDGSQAILMTEQGSRPFGTSVRNTCYVRCTANIRVTDSRLRQVDVGLVSVLGYYDASQVCQPALAPASATNLNEAMALLCKMKLEGAVDHVDKWLASGKTFFYMLHTHPVIHLDD